MGANSDIIIDHSLHIALELLVLFLQLRPVFALRLPAHLMTESAVQIKVLPVKLLCFLLCHGCEREGVMRFYPKPLVLGTGLP